MARPCQGKKLDGSPCLGHAQSDAPYCYFHSAESRALRKAKARARSALVVMPFAPLAPGEYPLPKFDKADSCRHFLEEMTRLVLEGRVSANTARSVTSLVNSALSVHALTIEERLSNLEMALSQEMGRAGLPSLTADFEDQLEDPDPERQGLAPESQES